MITQHTIEYLTAWIVMSCLAACGTERHLRPLFTPAPGATVPATPVQSAIASPLAGQMRWYSSVIERRIDLSALDATVSLTVEVGVTVEARRIRVETDDIGYSWFGRIGQRGFAEFVVHGGDVTGTIFTGAATYQVIPLGKGQHAIARLSRTGMPPEHPPGFRTIELHPGVGPPEPNIVSSSPTQIEVIVAYSLAVARARQDIVALIRSAINETNFATQDSGVKITFHLAHTFEAAYTEDPDLETNLVWFERPDDRHIDEVHRLRDRHKADLAILVLDNSGSYRGMAAKIMASAPEAFAVVDYRFLTGYFTLAHEIGHLMGLRHAIEEDSQTEPFADGHGYRHSAENGGEAWSTIMATDCQDGCQRIPRWSSPDGRYDDAPTGISGTSNAAHVLDLTRETVARFRGR